MGIKTFRPYTPSRRNMTMSTFEEITKKTPEKSLLAKKKKNAGRNSYGRITVRHQGGGNRQKYRIIDLEDMLLEAQKNNDKFILKVYDDNAIAGILQYETNEDFNIKLNKKTKLFI